MATEIIEARREVVDSLRAPDGQIVHARFQKGVNKIDSGLFAALRLPKGKRALKSVTQRALDDGLLIPITGSLAEKKLEGRVRWDHEINPPAPLQTAAEVFTETKDPEKAFEAVERQKELAELGTKEPPAPKRGRNY